MRTHDTSGGGGPRRGSLAGSRSPRRAYRECCVGRRQEGAPCATVVRGGACSIAGTPDEARIPCAACPDPRGGSRCAAFLAP
jgi:hypothetical protein